MCCEQTSRHVCVMSVIPLKADIHQRGLHGRLVPPTDVGWSGAEIRQLKSAIASPASTPPVILMVANGVLLATSALPIMICPILPAS